MKVLARFVGVATAAIALSLLAGQNVERIVVKEPFGQHKPGGSGNPPQILYHGGKILTGTVPIYVIYYGSTGSFPLESQPIVNNFLANLSATPQFDVNTRYCNVNTTTCPGGGTSVSGMLSMGQIYTDFGSQGASLNSRDIGKIVESALTTGPTPLPTDDGAIYIVITAPTIRVSGFCKSYCAYHTASTTIVSGHTIHYALAPEPNSKCTACDGNFAMGESKTPNDDPGADEIVDALMHEISETVTDPDISAWYTSSGAENGDLCNFVYGTATFQAANGATANVKLGPHQTPYLVQLIWENRPLPQGCAAAP